jgi:hypothetical protein
MKNKNFSELLNEALAKEPDLDQLAPDMDKIKNNIPQSTSEKICEMIVCDRYFGFGEKIAPFCMEELGKRRIAGDTFDFESYIDQAYKSLPTIPTVVPNIRDVLQQAVDLRNKNK